MCRHWTDLTASFRSFPEFSLAQLRGIAHFQAANCLLHSQFVTRFTEFGTWKRIVETQLCASTEQEAHLCYRVSNHPGCPSPKNLPKITWLQYECLPCPWASLIAHAPKLCCEVIYQLLGTDRLNFKPGCEGNDLMSSKGNRLWCQSW